MGPEPPYFLPEFLHRRRPSRQLGPRHLPGQRRPYMVMYARRDLHVRRPAFQAARGRFLRHPGRPGDEPGGGSAASPVVHHHARHRLPRPHDRGNPHRPPQHLRRPRRRGRHRGGPQRIRLVRQRGHLLLGPLARNPDGLLPVRPLPQQHGRGRQQRQHLVPLHGRRPVPVQYHQQRLRADPSRRRRTVLPPGYRLGRRRPHPVLLPRRHRPPDRHHDQRHHVPVPDRQRRDPLHRPGTRRALLAGHRPRHRPRGRKPPPGLHPAAARAGTCPGI